MTAIAGLNILNVPFLMGDLLLSSDDRPSRSVALPTLGSMPLGFKVDRRTYLAGVRQKVCLLNRNLAVAWSGAGDTAMNILSAMRTHFEYYSTTPQSLQDFVTSYSRQEGDLRDIALIFLISERATEEYSQVSIHSLNAKTIDLPTYGRCYVSGSGGDLIEKYLRENIEYELPDGDVNALRHAFFRAQGIAARMMADELRVHNTLHQRSGGGAEICLFTDGKLMKIGGVFYLNWTYCTDDDGYRLELTSPILKFDYVDDILVVRRLQVASDMKGNVSMHLVQPAYRSITTFERDNTWADWDAQCVVNTVRMVYNNMVWYGIMLNAGSDLPIGISEEGGNIYIHFDKAWIDTFFAHNKAAFESRNRT